MTYQHLTYREIQIYAKSLGLSASGKRSKIIGRITMYHFWQNKKQQQAGIQFVNQVENQLACNKISYVQKAMINFIYMFWIYLILNQSNIHLIRQKLRLY